MRPRLLGPVGCYIWDDDSSRVRDLILSSALGFFDGAAESYLGPQNHFRDWKRSTVRRALDSLSHVGLQIRVSRDFTRRMNFEKSNTGIYGRPTGLNIFVLLLESFHDDFASTCLCLDGQGVFLRAASQAIFSLTSLLLGALANLYARLGFTTLRHPMFSLEGSSVGGGRPARRAKTKHISEF
ncbi:hypothetical protein Bca4012_065297 [Brassica carinata]